jgi:hypothetical protein
MAAGQFTVERHQGTPFERARPGASEPFCEYAERYAVDPRMPVETNRAYVRYHLAAALDQNVNGKEEVIARRRRGQGCRPRPGERAFRMKRNGPFDAPAQERRAPASRIAACRTSATPAPETVDQLRGEMKLEADD